MTLVRAGGSLRSSRAIERRRSPRRIPAPDEPSSRIRLRAGREFVTVDISSTGLLAEGETRLLPGTHVDVHLVTRDGRLLVRSRVVRAFVCHVSHHEIRYRGALAFDHPVDTDAFGYPMPEASETRISEQGNPYPEPAVVLAASPDHASFP